jgi:uncharacterized protein
MNFSEEPISFECEQETLVGVLAKPQTPASIGLLVIVGGPQYRVGSHRQFVLLTRALATAGIAALRFDYRGMGDSTGEHRGFDSVTADIGAAIDAMQSRLPSIDKIALWGLCDGASAALMYCGDTSDRRVHGLCLLNPWVRSEASLARANVKHYYLQRLRQKEFWIKLFSGRVASAAVTALWRNVRLMGAIGKTTVARRESTFQQRMADAWREFDGSIQLMLSAEDYTAKEFLEFSKLDPSWAGLLTSANVTRHDFIGADHTFSDPTSRSRAEALTVEWLQTRVAV